MEAQNSIEVVSANVVDGVEFYVSNDGTNVGISISGLARLCGLLSVNNLRTMLTSLNSIEGTNTYNSKTAPKQLECLRGKVFTSTLSAKDSQGNLLKTIVDFKAASRIIRYYAYEAKNISHTAKAAYDKFAEMGLDRWIKQVTGYQETVVQPNDASLMSLLQQMMGKIESIERKQDAFMLVAKVYPTFEALTQDAIANPLLQSGETYTVKEWLALEKPSTELDKSQYYRLCSAISLAVKALQGYYPESRPNKQAVPIRVYRQQHFSLMNKCLEQIEVAQYN